MCIIESKPDNIPADLRIVTPWPELQGLADSIDLNTCDDITHKHTPWGAQLLLFSTFCTRDSFQLQSTLAPVMVLPPILLPQPLFRLNHVRKTPGQAALFCHSCTYYQWS